MTLIKSISGIRGTIGGPAGQGLTPLDVVKYAAAYGTWVEKSMYGKKYMGMERSSFLVDAGGKVARVWRKVKPEAHAADVLAAAAALK